MGRGSRDMEKMSQAPGREFNGWTITGLESQDKAGVRGKVGLSGETHQDTQDCPLNTVQAHTPERNWCEASWYVSPPQHLGKTEGPSTV